MLVKDLIETLRQYNPEAEVHLSYVSGDYWKTVVSAPVRNVDKETVEYSEYHCMYKVVSDENSSFDETNTVVAISL